MWLVASVVSRTMFFVGLALLTLILVRRSYKYFGPRRTKRGKTDPHLEKVDCPIQQDRPVTNVPVEVLRWEVQMHETARDLKAEIDSKMCALQVLIRQAREEADRLEKLLGAESSEPSDESTSTDRDRSIDIRTNGAPAAEPILPGTTQCRDEIYALADEGQTPTTIASLVGAPVGEIELILSLRSAQ